MQHSRQVEASIGNMLVAWVWDRLQRVRAMRDKNRAVVIAALTAASGNPPGA